jgi:hypothetical protein
MSTSKDREDLAWRAFGQAFGTEAGDDGVNLFVQHHLDELPGSYWQQHLASAAPEPSAVLKLLELRSSWGEDDLEYFDFTLPGDVTDYVVSVHFDGSGRVDGISMES